MKFKKLIALIISAIAIVTFTCFTGCTKVEDYKAFSNSEFEVISTSIDAQSDSVIMYHKETRVMYLFIKCGRGAGLTVMVDKDGTPLIYKGN